MLRREGRRRTRTAGSQTNNSAEERKERGGKGTKLKMKRDYYIMLGKGEE